MPGRAWILAWIIALTPLLGFWAYGLFDLDEGIYAASLREMMARGDAFVIMFDGAPFLEKPILVYWVAWGFDLLGFTGEFGLRLGSVLAAIGTLAICTAFARRRFGEHAGAWTLLILACSPLFMIVARMFIPDALFVFFLTASLLVFWESLERRGLRILSAVLLAAAALAKGPVAPAIFLLLVIYALFRLPTIRHGLRGGWVVGTLAFISVVALWYVPIMLDKGPEFVKEFILFQNLGRLAGEDEAHRGDFYIYVPIIFVALAPFIFAIKRAFIGLRSKPIERFLWAWAILVFVIFSAAGSKLPHYILPCLPPLAILLAAQLAEDPPSGWWAVGWAIVAAAGVWTAWGFLEEYRQAVMPLAGGASLGVLLSLRAVMRGARLGAAGAGAAWPVAVAGLVLGVPAYWQVSHADAVKAAEAAYADGGEQVVEFRVEGLGGRMVTSHPSTYWYFGRPRASTYWFDELVDQLPAQGRILTRRSRLTLGHLDALRSLGLSVSRERVVGEYEIYRFFRDPNSANPLVKPTG